MEKHEAIFIPLASQRVSACCQRNGGAIWLTL